MPKTPSAIGRGITAITCNILATAADLDLAEELLSTVGKVVRLEGEYQMDAVTAVSGSGPAYVFHLIEALSIQLAKATVAGSGELAMRATEDPAQLRVNVTSPGGTTAANKLMLERRLDPCMSEVFPWDQIPQAHMKMRRNQHKPGNMAVLVQSPRPGLRTFSDALEAGRRG